MRPTRVLHLIDTGGPGGAETICLNLVAGLDSSRWESIPVLPERGWLWQALEDRGFRPILLPSTRAFDVGYLARLVSLGRSRRIDLFQTHLLGSAVYGAMAARLLGGIPQVSTFHGTVDVSVDDPHLRTKMRVVDRSSSRLVFVSHSLERFFARSVRMKRASAGVVYNGIDLGVFEPGEAPEIRMEFDVEPGEILIGAVGNLRPAKAYDVLLRAMAELGEGAEVRRCLIVGEGSGPLERELRALQAELGLGDLVRFTGFRSDIARVLKALDLLVISSSSEGFSLTAVQALATGIPVVSTRCGGPEEILEGGAAGVLVERASPSALAEGIRRVCRDESLRERLVARGLEVARSRFSVERMIDGYEAIYEGLLRPGGRGTP